MSRGSRSVTCCLGLLFLPARLVAASGFAAGVDFRRIQAHQWVPLGEIRLPEPGPLTVTLSGEAAGNLVAHAVRADERAVYVSDTWFNRVLVYLN